MRNMRTLSTRVVYEVPTGPAIRWHVNVAGELGSCTGKVWLTRESDPADYWLEQGRPLQVRAGDVLWIGVDDEQPGRIELRYEARARRGLLAGLRTWLGAGARVQATVPTTGGAGTLTARR